MGILYFIVGFLLICGIIFNVITYYANKKHNTKKDETHSKKEIRQSQITKYAKDKNTKATQKTIAGEKLGAVVKRLYSDVTLYENGIVINGNGYALKEIIGCQITDPLGEWAEKLGLSNRKRITW